MNSSLVSGRDPGMHRDYIVFKCRWFAKCENEATKQVEHPILGWVDTCDDHIAWLGPSPSPIQFVPPLAAAVLDRRGLKL